MGTPIESGLANEKILSKKERILSIDVFRGLIIAGMTMGNYLGEYAQIPSWFKHAHGVGLSIIDIGAPIFIFAIALTYHMMFMKNRLKVGSIENFMHFFRRFLALMGIGFLATGFWITPTQTYFFWNVLQAIGFAGIFTLFFIRIPRWYRLGLTFIFIVFYMLVMGITVDADGTPMLLIDIIRHDFHGGIFGAIGWALMLLLSTIISEALEEKKFHQFLLFGIICIVIALVMNQFALTHAEESFLYKLWGISKQMVTVAYILESVGISSILFYIIWWVYDYKHWTKDTSKIWQPFGKNSLFLYLVSGIINSLMMFPFLESFPVYGLFFWSMLNVFFVWLIAKILDNKKIYIIL